MASDLNQCNFTGRLGKDPVTRYAPDGGAITNISIACNWKTKEKEGVEWVPIVFFGKVAEIAGEYLKSGSQVRVTGNFRTRKWQDKEGKDRYTTEIVANELQMLGSRPTGQSDDKPEAAAPAAPDFDDDIPF